MFTIVFDDAATYAHFPLHHLGAILHARNWCLRIMFLDAILPVAPEGTRMYAVYNKETMQHEAVICI